MLLGRPMRAAAALLALLVGGAPLLSTAHLALIQHATCEHGESIEIVTTDSGEQHQHAGRCIREAANAHEHGHEHCTVAGHRHVRALSGAAHDVSSLDSTQIANCIPDATAPPQLAVLVQAPKTSPPV